MDARLVRTIKDNTDCDHSLIVGPQKTIEDKLLVGHCDSCGHEVALELDKSGERTGRSWLVQYDKVDDKRLKKQIADTDGARNAVDDVLTHKNTDVLPMEDEHEQRP